MENLWPGIEYHYQVVSGATTCAGTFETNSGRTREFLLSSYNKMSTENVFQIKMVCKNGGMQLHLHHCLDAH